MSLSTWKHPDHPHELKRENNSITYTCNGCFEPGSETRYECKRPPCKFHLHFDCVDAVRFGRTIYHKCSDGTDFKFHGTPQSSDRDCYLCARPVEGYHYRNCKGFYLHPTCAKLPINKIEDGVEWRLCKEMSEKCYLCGNKKYGTSWSYVSREGSLHVRCVKEKLIEKLKELNSGHVDGANKGKGKAKDEGTSLNKRSNQIQYHDKSNKRSDKLGKVIKIVQMILSVVLGVLGLNPTALIVTLANSILGGPLF